jgi:hypothetical protein
LLGCQPIILDCWFIAIGSATSEIPVIQVLRNKEVRVININDHVKK